MEDGTYRVSGLVIATNTDAGYLNETKSCSWAGTQIYLFEDNPIPQFNWTVLKIAQIIKFAMSLASETELVGLFITAKGIVPLLQTLIKIVSLQLRYPV